MRRKVSPPHKTPSATLSCYEPSEPAAWVRKPCFSGEQLFSTLFAESVPIFPFSAVTTWFATTNKVVQHSHNRFLLMGSQRSEYCSKSLKFKQRIITDSLDLFGFTSLQGDHHVSEQSQAKK